MLLAYHEGILAGVALDDVNVGKAPLQADMDRPAHAGKSIVGGEVAYHESVLDGAALDDVDASEAAAGGRRMDLRHDDVGEA